MSRNQIIPGLVGITRHIDWLNGDIYWIDPFTKRHYSAAYFFHGDFKDNSIKEGDLFVIYMAIEGLGALGIRKATALDVFQWRKKLVKEGVLKPDGATELRAVYTFGETWERASECRA